ncbi:hypothetical protein D7X94_06385 [Acutalibacter sp. 1XD8-33]|nr:hypothetical protein D7X94_06385 [Acutalibacter sp. 1XD8-33]
MQEKKFPSSGVSQRQTFAPSFAEFCGAKLMSHGENRLAPYANGRAVCPARILRLAAKWPWANGPCPFARRFVLRTNPSGVDAEKAI